MTSAQKTEVKHKMIAELNRLTQEIVTLEEVTRPVSAEDMDEITRMDSIVHKSVNEAALAAAKTRLAGLEYAIKRIDEPKFGCCIDCGEKIGFARLLAMPETVRCIDCAS
ncbi:MAG: TraR/DksA family transcriptional regulator [Desulfovibrio sp.]|jgi:DnaK suppressor protein|nr:TraR/DksA family transcriptional regulator [Desulfovibrio sp.]